MALFPYLSWLSESNFINRKCVGLFIHVNAGILFMIFGCSLLDKMSAYDHVVSGKLKLKGKALDVKTGGIKKKKKKTMLY